MLVNYSELVTKVTFRHLVPVPAKIQFLLPVPAGIRLLVPVPMPLPVKLRLLVPVLLPVPILGCRSRCDFQPAPQGMNWSWNQVGRV